ncbi:hypothetical protein OAB00_01610 [Akkermansiaceae bacterium]|nr:hypothetical protein [Akkermansiaceae bacterium]
MANSLEDKFSLITIPCSHDFMTILLNKVLPSDASVSEEIKVLVIDRTTLSKRRWRAVQNGQEIAVGLEAPVGHGTILANEEETHFYRIEQIAEEVVSIPIPEDQTMAAKIGWYLGNRHIPIEVRSDVMVMENFPTLMDSLERIGIKYALKNDILRCAAHSADHRH